MTMTAAAASEDEAERIATRESARPRRGAARAEIAAARAKMAAGDGGGEEATRAMLLMHLEACGENREDVKEDFRQVNDRIDRVVGRFDLVAKEFASTRDSMDGLRKDVQESMRRLHERIDKGQRGALTLERCLAGTILLMLISAVVYLLTNPQLSLVRYDFNPPRPAITEGSHP